MFDYQQQRGHQVDSEADGVVRRQASRPPSLAHTFNTDRSTALWRSLTADNLLSPPAPMRSPYPWLTPEERAAPAPIAAEGSVPVAPAEATALDATQAERVAVAAEIGERGNAVLAEGRTPAGQVEGSAAAAVATSTESVREVGVAAQAEAPAAAASVAPRATPVRVSYRVDALGPDEPVWLRAVPGRVASLGLNVRSGPTAETTVLGELLQDARVQVRGRHGAWLRIDFGDGVGYVHGKFIEGVQSTSPAGAPPRQAAAPVATTMSPEVQAIGERLARDPLGTLAEMAGPADAAAPATATRPTGPTPTVAAPAVVAPAPIAEVAHTSLGELAARVGSREAMQVAQDVEALKRFAAGLIRDKNEERHADRATIVASIAKIRQAVAALSGAEAHPLRTAVYAALQEVSPFYFQNRNVDVLETANGTRTCNVSAIGMALESLGIAASAYNGNRQTLLAIARYFTNSNVTTEAQFATMRMPDFLQLAMIEQKLGPKAPTSENIAEAGRVAWDAITGWGSLEKLAEMFGVPVARKPFDVSGSIQVKGRHEMVRRFGHKHRMTIEAVKNAEAGGTRASEKQQSARDAALADESIDHLVSVEQYRASVRKEIGGEIMAGKAVVAGLSNHFARVEGVYSDYVVIDDPARLNRGATKLSYAEARAMGYFWYRMVIG